MNTSSLSRSQQQGGYALIIVLMLSMVILLGLVVVTSNFALTTRRTTTEQKAVVPAQLAAESGVAYAKAKLTTAYNILSKAAVPDGTVTVGTIQTALRDLCPNSPTVPAPNYVPATALSVTVPGSGGRYVVQRAALICDFTTNPLTFTAEQAKLFTVITPDPAPGSATVNQYIENGLATDDITKRNFYRDLFSYDMARAAGDAQVKSGLKPLALLQTNSYEYRFYYQVADVDSVGTINNSTRRMRVAGNKDSFGVLEIKFTPDPGTTTQEDTQNTFASYGVFYNTWDPSGMFTDTYNFSGKFHSNQSLTLANGGSTHTASFNGPLTLAGCSSVITKVTTDGNRSDTCRSPNSGINYKYGKDVYSYRSRYLSLESSTLDVSTVTSPYNTPLGSYDVYNIGSSNLRVPVRQGQPKPDLGAAFVQMPVNDNSQSSLAATAGITLGDPRQVRLSVANGIQYIQVTPETGKSYTLSFGADKVMYIDTGNGRVKAKKVDGSPGWQAAPAGAPDDTSFNGVIYATGTIGSLTGPKRTNYGSSDTAGPAVASFANLNVTARNDIKITGDLKYESPCTSAAPCDSKDSAGSYNTKNILGIYSNSGQIYYPMMQNVGETDGTQIDIADTAASNKLNAPANLKIDAFLMAAKGSFRPLPVSSAGDLLSDDQDSALRSCRCQRGQVTINGGLIQQGSVLTTNADRSSGFSWNSYYDKRGLDYSPKGFPTTLSTTTTTSVTNPVTDSSPTKNWQISFTKVNPDGTPKRTGTPPVPVQPDFKLDNEARQVDMGAK